MVAVTKELFIEQGATFTLHFQWRIPSGVDATTPKDLTGWTFRMQCRKAQQSAILFEATTQNGKITLGDDPTTGAVEATPTNGWVNIKLPPTDTNLLTTPSARYDLEAVDPNGIDVYRLLKGSIAVDGNITQIVSDPPMGV